MDAFLGIQAVLYIPLMALNLPAVVNECFQALIPVSTFDPYPELILEFVATNMFGFQETNKVPQNGRIAGIGFESRNAVEGLGGNFITLMLFVGAKMIYVVVRKMP